MRHKAIKMAILISLSYMNCILPYIPKLINELEKLKMKKCPKWRNDSFETSYV